LTQNWRNFSSPQFRLFLTLKEAGRRTSERVAAIQVGKKGLKEAITGKRQFPSPKEVRTSILKTAGVKPKLRVSPITAAERLKKPFERPISVKKPPEKVLTREFGKEVKEFQAAVRPAKKIPKLYKTQTSEKIAGIPVKETKLSLKNRIELLKRQGFKKEAEALKVQEKIIKPKKGEPKTEKLFTMQAQFPVGKVKPKGKVKEGLPMVEEIAKIKAEKAQLKLPPKTVTIKAPPVKKKISFDPEKHSLVDFVRQRGGLSSKQEGLKGEVRQFSVKEGYNLVNNKTGKTFDELRVEAVEAGFLNKDATVSDFINLLADDVYAKVNKKPSRAWSNRKQSFVEEEEFSFKQWVKDINTIIGEKGAIGKTPRTPEQIAAQQRLNRQVDEFVTYLKDRGIKTTQQIEKTLKQQKVPERIVQMVVKRSQEGISPVKAPIEFKETPQGKFEDAVKQHEDLGKALIARGEKNGNKELIRKGVEELDKARLNHRDIIKAHQDPVPPDIDLPLPKDKVQRIVQGTTPLQKFARSVEYRIDQLGGKEGKEINRLIKIKNNTQQIMHAKFIPYLERFEKIRGIRKFPEGSKIRTTNALMKGDPSKLSRRERQVYEVFKEIYKDAAEMADKYGIETITSEGKKIPWRKMKNPYSLMYEESDLVKPMFKNNAMKYLEGEKERISKALGYKETQSSETLWTIWRDNQLNLNSDVILNRVKKGEDLPERLAKNLEFSRVFQIPGYLTDPFLVAERYIKQITKRFSEIVAYGKKYDELFKPLKSIYNNPEKVGNLNEVMGLVSHSNRWNPMDYSWEKISSWLRATSVPSLTFSTPISFFGGISTTLFRGGITPTVKHAIKTIPQMSRKLAKLTGMSERKFSQEIGFGIKRYNSMMMEEMYSKRAERFSEAYLKYNFFKMSEDYTKIIASAVGRDHVYWLAKRLAKTKKSKFTEWLQDLSIRDSEIKMLMSDVGKLSKKQMFSKYDDIFKRGALEFANKTQGLPSRLTVPQWASSPIGKIVFQYKNVSYRLGREYWTHVRDATKDPGRAARMALALPVAGVLAYETQKGIRNTIREMTGVRAIKEKSQTDHIMRMMAKVNMFGFYGENIERLLNPYYPESYTSEQVISVLGPTASRGVGLVKTVKRAVGRATETSAEKRKKEKYYRKRGLKRPGILQPAIRAALPFTYEFTGPPPKKEKTSKRKSNWNSYKEKTSKRKSNWDLREKKIKIFER